MQQYPLISLSGVSCAFTAAVPRRPLQDRIKIQTLLALSQPITPDITVVFQALAPDACPPPLPPPSGGARPLDRSSASQNNRRLVTSNSPSRRSVAAAATAGTNARRGESAEEGGSGVFGDESPIERPRNVERGSIRQQQQRRRGRWRYFNDDGIGSDGGGDGEQRNSEGEKDTDGEYEEEEGVDDACRDSQAQEEEATEGVSYGLRPGRRWTSERGEGNRGHADRRRGGRGGSVSRRRRRRTRSRDGGGSRGTRKSREANRLRCTRGYQQHLEGRLELTQVRRWICCPPPPHRI